MKLFPMMETGSKRKTLTEGWKRNFMNFCCQKNNRTLTFWILENLRWEKAYNTISTINLSPLPSPLHSFSILQAKQLFCVPISILIFSCRCVSYVPHYLNDIQCQVLSILWLICHSKLACATKLFSRNAHVTEQSENKCSNDTGAYFLSKHIDTYTFKDFNVCIM